MNKATSATNSTQTTPLPAPQQTPPSIKQGQSTSPHAAQATSSSSSSTSSSSTPIQARTLKKSDDNSPPQSPKPKTKPKANTTPPAHNIDSSLPAKTSHTQGFSINSLLTAFSNDPKVRASSDLRKYIDNLPCSPLEPLPEILIHITPQDLSNQELLSTLAALQKEKRTAPIKVLIKVNDISQLIILLSTQLNLLSGNPAIHSIKLSKEISLDELKYIITPQSLILALTHIASSNKNTPILPINVTLSIDSIDTFIDTDFSFLPKNIHLTLCVVKFKDPTHQTPDEPLLFTEDNQSAFQTKLNALEQIRTLFVNFEFSPNTTLTVPAHIKHFATLKDSHHIRFAPNGQCSDLSLGFVSTTLNTTIPASVKHLSTGNVYGTLEFEPNTQCSSIYSNNIYSPLTIPASVTVLSTGKIASTLEFAPDSQCTTLSIDLIEKNATITVPKSVTKLTIDDISGTLNFEPGFQCSEISLGTLWSWSTVTIPAYVTTLTTDTIEGTLLFEPDSQCSSLHLGFIFPDATVTIPASVKKLTIDRILYTGQKLLDLKSGKTSLKNVTFEQQ